MPNLSFKTSSIPQRIFEHLFRFTLAAITLGASKADDQVSDLSFISLLCG